MSDNTNLTVDIKEKDIVNVELVEKEKIAINLVENEIIPVELVENEVITVKLVEHEIIKIDLTTIDVVPGGVEGEVDTSDFIYNETPTQVNSIRFATANSFQSGTLRVYRNGLREEVTIINISTFELFDAFKTGDIITVDYIKS